MFNRLVATAAAGAPPVSLASFSFKPNSTATSGCQTAFSAPLPLSVRTFSPCAAISASSVFTASGSDFGGCAAAVASDPERVERLPEVRGWLSLEQNVDFGLPDALVGAGGLDLAHLGRLLVDGFLRFGERVEQFVATFADGFLFRGGWLLNSADPRFLGLHVLVAVARDLQEVTDSVPESGTLHLVDVTAQFTVDEGKQREVIFVEDHWGNGLVKVLFAEDERAVDKVADVFEQFAVVSGGEVVPAEARVLAFGTG
ncbi:conserved hypothetical protein [Culex quinquefasciatus]|uniref:Uncharacterized protein n=1 Tax=Culex quinquefasciatus TaxID=7176 RepID=B0WBN5_CULQU|nr:conserved hypothetical protein [Culex quinquefasciatus]|eukprot:XP_001846119.1 conserved hypothetical protein [Culex quinquefasciatus]